MGATCRLCGSPARAAAETKAKTGAPLADVVRLVQSLDSNGISRDAVSRHLRNHVHLPARSPGARPISGDLMAVVRDRVLGRVVAGELEPTVAEGIRSQEGLDRRAEKGADREVMLQMAQILGGALDWKAMIVPGESVRVVSPDDEAMEAEAEEDIAYFRALSSGEYVPPVVPVRDAPKAIARR